jgi:5'-nucleotidase
MKGKSERRIVLVTNDDGADAPGLAALVEAVRDLGDIWVVAPEGPRSSCGHAITTNLALRIERRGDRAFAVHGTPADCVRLAIDHLVPAVDCVLSGINSGGNLGVDIHHSGTVAAVREAVIHGRPGIALSQYLVRGRPVDWVAASRRAEITLALLLAKPWVPGTLWNVNLPHLERGALEPDVVYCGVDPSPLPLRFTRDGDAASYAGDYHSRARLAGSDIDVCFGGRIAVSRVRLMPADTLPDPRD